MLHVSVVLLQAGRSRVRFPMGSLGVFHYHNPSGRTVALGLTQSLTEMNTRNISWGVKTAGGPGSVVGIATGYGLDGSGIESRWRTRFSAPVQTGPGAHPASCAMGNGSFPGVKSGQGVRLTPRSLLVPWSRKSRAIPLLPLWAVRPVQSLNVCTRVHFTLPDHFHVPTVHNSWSLNLLQPSGPVQTCNGIPLPLPQHVSVIFQARWIRDKNIS